jgi:protein MpaA
VTRARPIALAACAALSLAAAAPLAATHAAEHRMTLGSSALGRPIQAIETGDSDSPVKVVVVGCIHGDEPAGIAVADVLETLPAAPGVDLWIVPDMNPDGVALGTRENAEGIDLNRNFPWDWRPPSKSAGRHSGRHPLSAPESRLVDSLLMRLKPTLVIWYHQALGLVDESGGSVAIEQRYAALVHLPLRQLPRYDGSATSWVDHEFPGTTSFVVELPPGSLTPAAARHYAHAVETVARGLG